MDGVREALDFYPDYGKLLLVGSPDILASELTRTGLTDHPRIEVIHSGSVVGMDESAAKALSSKKDSSIAVAVDLVKSGRAGAVFSAGNTGAMVAASVLKLRPLAGIDRPGIATVFPSPTGVFLLLDAGANVDAKPRHLVQYAIMGDVYAREILRVSAPRVGLLSVGAEDVKGNELTKQAFRLLNEVDGLDFVGNIEGHDLFAGSVDVVVCDGFVGNVVLKSCESLAKAMGHFLREMLQKNTIRKLGALLSRDAYRELKELSDHQQYGGAPLLGVNGVCIIGHGSSSSVGVRNAIRVAGEFMSHQVNNHITDRLATLGPKGAPAVESAS
jgi:glycerol-3-phosphate acyltransferase PlsX